MAWMILPMVACLLMALALGWFGLQVLEREVIFVDLALAQVAALGTTYAVFLGHEPDAPVAYALGLVFTLIGAVAFSMARRFEARVPQEAIIGIAYAVSAAAGAVVLDLASDPHGAEKLQHLTVGNIVWVTPTEIGAMAAIMAAIGLFHFVFRRQLLMVTFEHDKAEAEGVSVAMWDLLFYLTFGVVITTIVHVGGVLLIFSYLIIPAVVARLFVDGIVKRLAVAWTIAFAVSVVGVSVSYEHAAGPIIVVLLGAVLLVGLIVYAVQTSPEKGRTVGGLAGAVAVFAVILFAFSRIPADDDEHQHLAAADAAPAAGSVAQATTAAGPTGDASAREAWYRAHATDAAALEGAASTEQDASLRLLLGTALVKDGDAKGLAVLADVAKSDTPFLRMEADDTLRKVAGDGAPAYDPMSAPDTGVWATWATNPPADWATRASTVELP